MILDCGEVNFHNILDFPLKLKSIRLNEENCCKNLLYLLKALEIEYGIIKINLHVNDICRKHYDLPKNGSRYEDITFKSRS